MPSTYMGLTIPSVGVTSGSTAASNLVSDLNIIDSHDHSNGYGNLITPSGLNINADLTFGSFNATNLNSARFTNRSSAITASSPNTGCLYVVSNNLYFNDGSNQIQITAAGAVSGATGTITGMSGNATAVFSTPTFIFSSDTNVRANVACRDLLLANSGASSYTMSLVAPTLAADKTITFPNPPAATKIVQMDSSGNLAVTLGVDNSSIEISGNNLQVKSGGITSAMIANGAIVNDDVNASAAIAYSKLNLSGGIVNADISSSAAIAVGKLAQMTQAYSSAISTSTTSTSYASIGSAGITTAVGRPVYVNVMTSNSDGTGFYCDVDGATSPVAGMLKLVVSGVAISNIITNIVAIPYAQTGSVSRGWVAAGTLNQVLWPNTAGTLTVAVHMKSRDGSTVNADNIRIELFT